VSGCEHVMNIAGNVGRFEKKHIGENDLRKQSKRRLRISQFVRTFCGAYV